MVGKHANPYAASILGAQKTIPMTLSSPINLHPRISWTTASKSTSLTNGDLPKSTADHHYFQIDSVLLYEHFFADHGPLNLGQTVRFCRLVTSLLSQRALAGKRLVYVCSSHNHRRSNSIFLICSYLIICEGKSVAESYAPFFDLSPTPSPFRDAAFSICPYTITVIDALKGLSKAMSLDHFVYETFDSDAYDDMDKLENGDCTWIVPGKLMAFSGPHNHKKEISPGVFTMSIDEYAPLFKRYGVTGVVRFNKKLYDKQALTKRNVNHYDLYYEDGGNPTEAIAQRFLKICEDEKGAVAVHCKAGLGRTGTNIGNYMIKHYGYTTNEMIAWCRICRPGSVVGPQQQFCADYEFKLVRDGEAFRRRNGGGGNGATKIAASSAIVAARSPMRAAPISPEKDATNLQNLSAIKARQVATSPVKHRSRPHTGSGFSSGTMPKLRSKSTRSTGGEAASPSSLSSSRPKSSSSTLRSSRSGARR